MKSDDKDDKIKNQLDTLDLIAEEPNSASNNNPSPGNVSSQYVHDAWNEEKDNLTEIKETLTNDGDKASEYDINTNIASEMTKKFKKPPVKQDRSASLQIMMDQQKKIVKMTKRVSLLARPLFKNSSRESMKRLPTSERIGSVATISE